jgi:serine phosphatase RsbU (regulator of sigma subunit)
MAAASLPCKAIGGDFFDYFDLPDDAFALTLADIAGKGPPSALLSASLQAVLAVAPKELGPAATLALANQSMLRRPVPARYATVFYASITPGGRLTYSNAGHLPPLLIGRSGRRWLDRGGMVVGLFELATFEEEMVQLQEGDRLIVFSDGVTEAVNTKGEEFGEERLAACVEGLRHLAPADQVARIMDAVQAFAAGARQADDITALVLSYSSRAGRP